MVENEFQKTPKFLRRLFREVSNPENESISWSENGEKLRITDKTRFINNVLPKISRTKEYSTFIRQLNMYGFVKIRSDKNDETEEYYNSFFRRDDPSQMENLTRFKKYERANSKMSPNTIEDRLGYLTSSNFKLTNELSELKEKVERQERTINGLLEILGKVFRAGASSMNYEKKFLNMRNDFGSNLLGGQDFPFDNMQEKKEIEEKKAIEEKGAEIIKDMNDIFF